MALSQPPCRPPRLARLALGPVPALSTKAARPMPISYAARAARLLAPQRGVVRSLQEPVEQRRRIAGIVARPPGAGYGKSCARDEIAPRISTASMPSSRAPALDQPLVGPGRLRPARAAIGIDRHGVGVDAAHPQVEVRRPVEAGHGLRIGIAGNAGREIAEIAAERRDGIDLHGHDPAVAVEPHAGAGVVIARLRVGQEGLGARGGPFDRPAQQLRGPHDGRDLDGEVALDAEAAADVGRDSPDAVLGMCSV